MYILLTFLVHPNTNLHDEAMQPQMQFRATCTFCTKDKIAIRFNSNYVTLNSSNGCSRRFHTNNVIVCKRLLPGKFVYDKIVLSILKNLQNLSI